jgi:hypothetical protein
MDNPTSSDRNLRAAPDPEKTIQEAYFEYLYHLMYDIWDYKSSESYISVCWCLHNVDFLALVDYDENRIADAAGLRNQFKDKAGSLGPAELTAIITPDCTVFEVLIALATRADFMVPLGTRVWFQLFLENLGLDTWSDEKCSVSTWPIERTINNFNNRDYRPNGKGGIFPLRQPKQDQRDVELWYQMGAYMTENRMY